MLALSDQTGGSWKVGAGMKPLWAPQRGGGKELECCALGQKGPHQPPDSEGARGAPGILPRAAQTLFHCSGPLPGTPAQDPCPGAGEDEQMVGVCAV